MNSRVRDIGSERIGTRYGSRTVIGVGHVEYSGVKYVALKVRCDCGAEDLIRKSQLKRGIGRACRECSYDEKSREMRGKPMNARWKNAVMAKEA